MADHLTDYGFTFGPAEVSRMVYVPRRGRVLEVKTPRHTLHIYITPKGHKVRVYENGEELKAVKSDG